MTPIENIRRNVFQVSQEVFAEIAGTTQPTVSRWEKEENDPLQPTLGQCRKIRQEALRRKLAWHDSFFFLFVSKRSQRPASRQNSRAA